MHCDFDGGEGTEENIYGMDMDWVWYLRNLVHVMWAWGSLQGWRYFYCLQIER